MYRLIGPVAVAVLIAGSPLPLHAQGKGGPTRAIYSHTPNGWMLDIYSDLTQHTPTLGGHIEILEVDELAAVRREVTPEQIDCRVAHFRDVFDVQPLPPDNALFDCPNLLLTPHTAGITATSSRAMAVGSAEEMLRILRGEAPLNLVNPACKAQ